MSIRWIVISILTLLLAGVLGSGYWLNRTQTLETARSVSFKELSLLAESIRSNIVGMMNAGANMDAMDAHYRALQEQHPEIRDLRILHGAAVTRQFGRHVAEEPRDEIERQGLQADAPTIVEAKSAEGGEVLRFVYPMKAESICLKCHQARLGEKMGAVTLTMDIAFVLDEIRSQQRFQMLVALGEVLILLVVLALVGELLVFRPLQRLRQGAERVAAGDFTRKVEHASHNEIGIVIDVFNNMADKLRNLLQEQDGLIQEQAKELTELVEQSQLIGSSADEKEVLNRFAKSLAESARVSWCAITTLDDTGSALRVKAVYSVGTMPQMAAHETVVDAQQCPNLWQLMHSKRTVVMHKDGALSATESALLFSGSETNVLCMPIIHKSKVHGLAIFAEFRSQERDPLDDRKVALCSALVSLIGSTIEISSLFSRLTEQSEEVVLAMAEAVEKKSPWTAGHSKRVVELSLSIAREMGYDAQRLEQLRVAGLLHDIGKIGMPGLILNKVGKLTEEEYAIVKRHPEDGAQILARMHLFRDLIPAIRHHHEWYNGQGYPDSLRGDEIPLSARILAVADAFDAMTADRPYRTGLSPEEALRRLQQAAGEQFDPEVVEAFTRVQRA